MQTGGTYAHDARTHATTVAIGHVDHHGDYALSQVAVYGLANQVVRGEKFARAPVFV